MPLLFVLAGDTCKWSVEGFLMTSYLEGIPLLQYADDATFFIEVSMEEAKNLSTLLDLFVDFWGLQINHAE